jgi:hypothetical protein
MPRLLLIPVMTTILAGCATHRPTPEMKSPDSSSSSSTTKTPATHPILYHRTGGIASTDDRVTIWPDGFVQVHGKLLGDADVYVPPERLQKLWRICRQSRKRPAGRFVADAQASIPDAYRVTLFFSGEIDQADDITAVAEGLTRFVAAYQEIEAIAAEAVNESTDKPVAP